MRRARTLGIVAIATVAVVIVGAFALLSTIDPNEYKATVQDVVAERIGLDVKIAGDLRVEMSLVPTIAIDGVTIASPTPGAAHPLAEIRRFDLSIELLPLLIGEMRLGSVRVEGVDAWVQPDIFGAASRPAAEAPERAKPLSEKSLAVVPHFADVRAREVRVHVANEDGSQTRTFEVDEVRATVASNEDRLDVEASGRLDGDPYRLAAQLGSPAAFRAGRADLKIAAELTALQARFEADGSIGRADGTLRPDVKLSAAGDRLRATLEGVGRFAKLPAHLSALNLGAFRAGLRLNGVDGGLRIEDIDVVLAGDPGLTVNVTGSVANALSLGGLDMTFGAAGEELSRVIVPFLPDMPARGTMAASKLGPFDLTGHVVGGPDRLSLPALALVFGSEDRVNLSLAGELHDLRKDPSVDVKVEMAGQELAALVEVARPFASGLSDVAVPEIGAYALVGRLKGGASRLSLSEFKFTAGRAQVLRIELGGAVSDLLAARGLSIPVSVRSDNLQPVAAVYDVDAPPLPLSLSGTLKDIDGGLELGALDLKAGQSDVAGRIAVKTRGGPPSLDGSLRSTLIDLDELVPKTAAPAGDAAPNEALAPPGLLGSLVWEVGTVRASGRPLVGATTVRLKSDAERLSLDLVPKGGPGGQLGGAFRIGQAGSHAPTSIDLSVKDLELGVLLQAMAGEQRLSGGLASGRVKLAGRSGSPADLRSSLAGTASFTMGAARFDQGDAKLLTGDVLVGVFDAINPSSKGAKKLEIKCAAARVWVEDGVVFLPGSVGVETQNFAALASGKIDLKAQTIDMSVRPAATKGLGISLAQTLAELVEIRGPLADPHIGVSELGAATMAARIAAAIATSGLSYLAELAVVDRDRLRRACTTASNATRNGKGGKSGSKPGSQTPEGVLEQGGDAVKGVIEGTGKAIGEGLNRLFGGPKK